MTTAVQDAIIYVRLSVETEESVSIDRQIESCEQYARARGWNVVGVARDPGVSATRIPPSARTGWRQVVQRGGEHQAVIVWKLDRVIRKLADYVEVDAELTKIGSGLVSVTEGMDMTTPPGRLSAHIISAFAEFEAAQIAARVKASRAKLHSLGRRSGGVPPYGYMNVPNPDGAGVVLAFDPDRIEVVRSMVDLALGGAAVYGIKQWLEREGVEPRSRKNTSGEWHAATVEQILRNPALAGMVQNTPGRKPGEAADPWSVVRHENGLPIVDEALAIITTDERRTLLDVLDAAKRPGTRPRSSRTPSLLAGLVFCGTCGQPLFRATAANGRYKQFRCQNSKCSKKATILRDPLEEHVEQEFLTRWGDEPAVELVAQPSQVPPRVGDIADALEREAARMIAGDGDDGEIVARVQELRRLRAEALAEYEAAPTQTWTYQERSNRQAWDDADSVESRRSVLDGVLKRVVVKPKREGAPRFDPGRIACEWNEVPGPDEVRVTPLLPFPPD